MCFSGQYVVRYKVQDLYDIFELLRQEYLEVKIAPSLYYLSTYIYDNITFRHNYDSSFEVVHSHLSLPLSDKSHLSF